MFRDCLRCGFGWHTKDSATPPFACPLCPTLTDEQAKYVVELHHRKNPEGLRYALDLLEATLSFDKLFEGDEDSESLEHEIIRYLHTHGRLMSLISSECEHCRERMDRWADMDQEELRAEALADLGG